jgi:hypothetical protein
MARLEDPVRVVVPGALAKALAEACTLEMDGHVWAAANLAAARGVLAGPGARALVQALARRLGRCEDAPGWAVLALPARLTDEELQAAAAGVLAAVGSPFYSVEQGGGRLWIGEESTAAKDLAAFGGIGEQGLHIDAPNVTDPPEFTSLLVLRPDPAGGGASLLGDLRAAAARLDHQDRAALAEERWFEGRAENLAGVGAVRLPFPVLDPDPDAGAGEPGWIRWAAKSVTDARNTHPGPLEHFAALLDAETVAVNLGRGQLLIVDQRRVAHGRAALGEQHGLADGTRRLIVQAKATRDAGAPAWREYADAR